MMLLCFYFQPQKQGKQFCGPSANSESQPETAACAQLSLVRRKKSRKIRSSDLTVEDVIEQVPEVSCNEFSQISLIPLLL